MHSISRCAASIRTVVTVLVAVLAPAEILFGGDIETATGIAQDLRSGGMKEYQIGVGVREGTVTLRGTVASKEQRDRAIRIARAAKGVTQVIDNLDIGLAGVAPVEERSHAEKCFAFARRCEDHWAAGSGLGGLLAAAVSVAVQEYLPDAIIALDVELDDGSRIVAKSVAPRRFRLVTQLGALTVPLTLVETLERVDDTNFRVRLTNGDTMTGCIEFPDDTKVRLVSAHGEVTVAPRAVVKMNRRDAPKLSRY